MKIGDKVRLVTFNGIIKSGEKGINSEDYWKLIGETGTIQQDPNEETIYASFSEEPRVLVSFYKNLSSIGLISHNIIYNSLWILVSDLKLIDSANNDKSIEY